MQQGVIKYFNREKGFGFIKPAGADANAKDLFFHNSGRQDMNWIPNIGDSVSFEVADDARGPKAIKVALADGSAAGRSNVVKGNFSASDDESEMAA